MILLEWARVYQSVYDMPPTDRPDNKIIENDAKLDRWFEEYQNEVNLSIAKAKIRQKKQRVEESTYMRGMPT